MEELLTWYIHQRIDQIRKSSQSVSFEEATSVEDVESMDVSKEFLAVLETSFKLKTQSAAELLEMTDLIDTTKSKMEILFLHIINLEAQEKDKKFDDIIALAITYFNMGLVYSDTKLQKLDIGATHFMTCMELLKKKPLERKAIVTVIKMLIQFHIMLRKCEKSQTSSLLNRAMELYMKYTKEEIEYPDPINFMAILGMDDEEDLNSKIILEKLQLETLIHMSLLYKENPCDKHKFVIYVHNILYQTIERVLDLRIVDWAVASSHLSQYFVYNYRFIEARNHMIAAEYMIKTFYIKVVETSNEENKSDLHEVHKNGYNKVIKFWGLYGAELFIASADGLLSREENNKSCETNKSESVVESEDFTNLLIFPGIEEKKLKNFTARFPDKCVSNLNDAKAIFVDVLKCFDTVKKYFTIEEHLLDFLEITITTSKVYKCLATFEQDIEKQMKLHERRRQNFENICFDILEKVADVKLNSPLFQMITMLMMEAIEVNINLLNIRIEQLQLNVEQPNKDFTKEIKKEIKQDMVFILGLFKFTIRMMV